MLLYTISAPSLMHAVAPYTNPLSPSHSPSPNFYSNKALSNFKSSPPPRNPAFPHNFPKCPPIPPCPTYSTKPAGSTPKRAPAYSDQIADSTMRGPTPRPTACPQSPFPTSRANSSRSNADSSTPGPCLKSGPWEVIRLSGSRKRAQR